MISNPLFGRRFEAPCTIRVEHTAESCHAHVDLPGDVLLEVGDEVIVQGEPVRAAFGDRFDLDRRAVIVKAGLMDRFWTRLTAWFELTELYEVSFSDRRRL